MMPSMRVFSEPTKPPLSSAPPPLRGEVLSVRCLIENRSRGFRFLALVLVVVALAACGKKGPPQPPPGQPVTYPQQYPKE